jgi:tetratricopeptide (TPR) repeat protein
VSTAPSAPATDGIDPKDGIRLLDTLNDARAATQLGHAEDAIAPLTTLLEKNPANVPAWLTLVSARLATGDPTSAVAAARRALRLRPQDDLVRFNLANGLAAEAATRPEAAVEAREQYEKTIALNPRRADAYLNYSGLLARLGELETARQVLDRAEAAELHSADLRFERAVLELRLGEIDAAVARFESVLELDPSDADAVEALARIALRRGHREEAIRRLEALLELKDPNDPTRAGIEARLAELRAVPTD